MSSKYDALVLNSGGMDSTTALAETLSLYSRVATISFDYGQRHARELTAADTIAQYYRIQHVTIDVTSLGEFLGGSALTDVNIAVPEGHYEAESMKITVVPNRNSIMLSIAFGIARAAGAIEVVAEMHSGDHAIYPDCRAEFAQSFNETMQLANADMDEPPILRTPFINQTKAQIVTIGSQLGVPYHLTYSCYVGGKEHCGKCGTCVERREAFEIAGVPDPTVYVTGAKSLRGEP